MQAIKALLGSMDTLYQQSEDETGKPYFHPHFKNLGAVNIIVLRETIAPVIFRNSEPEITDIKVNGELYVRGVPNKFKYPERSRGLQILRYMNAGGKHPQNRTAKHEDFDLNTLVFGDSVTQKKGKDKKKVYSVKAAVNYSDALSLLPKSFCTDDTLHNKAMEDGTLFNAVKHENSKNIFHRFFIKPDTLMLQVLSTRGKLLPPEGLDHLLLSMGLAGAYGGSTSIMGTNIRTHIVGVYGAHFEPEQSSPYVLLKYLQQQHKEHALDLNNVNHITEALHQLLSQTDIHSIAVDSHTVTNYLKQHLAQFEADDPVLKQRYQVGQEKITAFFKAWFTGKK